MRSVA